MTNNHHGNDGGVLSLLADLGRTIEEYLTNPLIMILVIIIAWVNHAVGALILTLLVIGIHLRRKTPPFGSPEPPVGVPPPPAPSSEKTGGNGFGILVGVVILLAGFYWLLRDLFPLVEIPWSATLIILGAVFLILGIKSGKK
ncbi:MAG: hypothetical protein QXF52_08775 [Thermoproteota archaeon]